MRSDPLMGAAWIALVWVAKYPVIDQAPVWDTAFSIFPAAEFLATRGFDYAALLGQPGFWDGGPNVHALSLLTLINALVVSVFGAGSGAGFVVLHAIQFVITGLGLAATFSLARRLLSPPGAALATLAVFLCPIVFVQSGFLYTDNLVTWLGVIAVWAWLRGSRGSALALCVVSVWLKPTGIVAAAALIVAELLAPTDWPGRLRRSLLLGLPTLLVFALHAVAGSRSELPAGAVPPLQCLQVSFDQYLLSMPDVTIGLCAALLVAGVLLLVRRGPQRDAAEDVLVQVAAAFVVAFCAFLLLSATLASGSACYLLPRYFAVVVPWSLLVGMLALRRLSGSVPTLAAIALCIWFLANHHGRFYPDYAERWANNPSIAQRSMEYRDLYELARSTSRRLEHVSRRYPTFVFLPEAYYLGYAANGYAAFAPAPVRPVDALDATHLARDCTFVGPANFIGDLAWTERLRRLVERRGTHEFSVFETFEKGRHRYRIHRIRRLTAPCDVDEEAPRPHAASVPTDRHF